MESLELAQYKLAAFAGEGARATLDCFLDSSWT
jgi:hypothetical protein